MKKLISGGFIILVCGFVAVLSFALWPTTTPEIGADETTFDSPELIAKGRYLATLGDCEACHTKPGAGAYAGGEPIASPIGAMYPPNISPDKQQGIGDYSLNDFARAVRNGIRKDGVTLYPAMPYPSYARLTDEDVIALYAYFQHGVKPDETANKENEISWPLSIRWPVAIWRKVYAPDAVAFDASRYQDAQLARGAYLVEGLGHCGTCHTPRAITLQEQGLDDRAATYLTGGQVIDGWYTPGLHNSEDGLKNWTEDDIITTLRTGRTDKSIVVGKPMNDVVLYSSSQWHDDDLKAVAAYLKSLPASEMTTSRITPVSQSIEQKSNVAFLYQTSCASCHGIKGEGKNTIFPALAGNNTVLAAEPDSLIRIVLDGYDVPVIDSNQLPMRMPHFRDRLTDQEIADVLTYIRQNWGNQVSAVTPEQVKKSRSE